MLQNKNLLFGYIFTIGATIIWAGNFIVARGLFEIIPPASFSFWRWLVATVFIFPFAIRHLIREWNILKTHFIYLSLCAALGITIFSLLTYIASHTTTALNLSLISITFPIFIVVISRIIFNERITRHKTAGIILVLSGVILLLTRGKLSRLTDISFAVGDIWMLIAAIAFAVYSILLRKKPKEVSIWSFQFCTYVVGVIFMLPFLAHEMMVTPPFQVTQKVIYAFLYGGVCASLIGFVLWNKAVILIGPVKAGFVYYTLPLFSGILGMTFLEEAITQVHLYCGLLIVSGILIANHKSRPPIKSAREDHPEDYVCSSSHTQSSFTSSQNSPSVQAQHNL